MCQICGILVILTVVSLAAPRTSLAQNDQDNRTLAALPTSPGQITRPSDAAPPKPVGQDNEDERARATARSSPGPNAAVPGVGSQEPAIQDNRVGRVRVAVPAPLAPGAAPLGAGTPKYVIEFGAQALGDAMRLLASQTKENIVVSADAQDVQVSLFLQDITLETALDALCETNNLTYSRDPRTGIIGIRTSKKLPSGNLPTIELKGWIVRDDHTGSAVVLIDKSLHTVHRGDEIATIGGQTIRVVQLDSAQIQLEISSMGRTWMLTLD